MMASRLVVVPMPAVILGLAPAPAFWKTTGLARVPVAVMAPAVGLANVSA